ncbi:PBSX family phage terminase large subunit [Escherichia coli]|nr:MAG: terminase [Bacteriophage sp.]WEV89053.1 terminase large subunit [Salmonella phage vB_SenS_ST1]HBM2232733.1 PBSX family phage terminase large subunit [Escherichia coli]UVX44470.1 MAG: Terminase [Bacteriophage sp.]UVY18706.1 MAG: Terminase [Bacteriophage sp.]
MARKRLSSVAIEKLEQAVGNSTSKPESAVFGIVNKLLADGTPNVIKRLKMTSTGVSETNEEPTILIPERMELLLYPRRFKVFYGGRGSGKTANVVSYLIEKARFRNSRVGCFREIQNSIKESSYAELVDEINRKGHTQEYRCVDGEITHHSTRSKFVFRGLWRNITAIKGMAGLTDVFCEESENISQVSWDTLIPTVRAAGSEIIIVFNPNKETDPTWTNFVAPYIDKMVDGIYQDDDIVVVNVNYIHNPWFTEELKQHMNQMKAVDYDRYLWVYEGLFNKRSDEAVLGGKWQTLDFEPSPEWGGPYYGIDFGFSQDATAATESYVEDLGDGRRNLYIYRDFAKVGLEITDTPEAMRSAFPNSEKYRWYGDCARPETISHIRRSGFDIHPCAKWPGSIEDGITWLRGCDRIYVHSRCRHVIEEMTMYSYKVDKLTGNILPDIVDKYNHAIDSLRYGLGDHIVQRGSGMLIRRRR